MATSPKIRFDIEANASGAAQVEKLATELEKLDGAIDPALAQKARDAAEALRDIGRQNELIDGFTKAKTASVAAAEALNQAQAAAQRNAQASREAAQALEREAATLRTLKDEANAAALARRRGAEAQEAAARAAEAARLEEAKLGRALQESRGATEQRTKDLATARRELAESVQAEKDLAREIRQAAKAAREAGESVADHSARTAQLAATTRAAREAVAQHSAELQRARQDQANLTQAVAQSSSAYGEQRSAMRAAEEEAKRLAASSAEAAAAAAKQAETLAKTKQAQAQAAGDMEKLRDAVREAKQELTSQTAGLDAARSALQQMGVPLDGVASKQRELRQSTEQLRQELQAVAQTASGASTFGTLVRDTDAARAKMEALAKAADLYAGSLGKSGPPTAAQATNLRTMQDAAAAARAEFERLQAETVQQATALRQAGVNTEQLAAKARELAGAERQAGAAAQQFGAQSAAAAGQAVRANDQVRDSVERIGGGLRSVASAAAAVVGGGLLAGEIGNVLRTADAYNNLAARIRITTGEGAAFERAFEGVFDVAKRTSSAIESTGTLFTRITRAGKELNISQRDALALTETINQAVQVSGASAESSDAALQQLIQGLQSGVLRGEEFNSVMEQAPRLAIALADGLGVTTGELRKQAEAGSLTSQVVIQALQGQAAVVANEFNQLPPTVGRALTNLSTEWTRYVGEVDKANGVSAAAASAINALAGNLDTLGAVLFSAGKAAAAYTAVRLAATFLANAQAATAAAAAKTQETAATAANSAAQAANTTATTANTAAKRANAAAATASGAAADGAVAGAGRLASIFATLRTFTLIGIVTNLQEIGTWLGESVAKWQGYGKAIEEAESKAKALDQAQREMAAQDAAIAQARQRAADATNGMTAAAKALVGAHNDVIKSGGTAAEALAKLASAANVSDTTGIKTVSAALDSLAQQGESASKRVAQTQQALNAALTAGGANMEANVQSAIGQLERLGPTGVAAADQLRGAFAEALQSGDFSNFGTMSKAVFDSISLRAAITSTQIRETLAAALKDEDLLRFETNARAAFDGSEQGARRLAAAIDAVGIEALRRAGTSAQELQTGFNSAMTSAVNDVDLLARELTRLQAPISETGRLLSTSLDKTLDTANTERAVQAVISRWEDLGRQGLVTGDQLSAGLEKARAKIDGLNPGINSLSEALATFGLKSQDQLQQTADNFRGAWEQIRSSVQVGIADKIKAFEQYRDAAAAANGGVVSGELRIQEEMLKSAAAARGVSTDLQGVSTAALDAGQSGQQAGQQIAGSFDGASQSIRQATDDVARYSTAQRNAALSAESAASDQARKQMNSTAVDAGGIFAVRDKLAAGTLSEEDRKLVEAVLAAEKQNSILNSATNPSAISFEGRRDAEARMATANRALEKLNSARDEAARQQAAEAARKDAAETARKQADTASQPSQKAPTISSTSTTATARTVNVNLTLGGRSVTIPTTESGAESLISVLEQAKAALGG